MQPQLDRRRGWRSVREIGSPVRLARLVCSLPRSAMKPSPWEATAADAVRIDTARRRLRRYIFLRSMRQTASQFVQSLALQPGVYEVAGTLDRAIAEEEQNGAIDHALAVAKSAMDRDFDLRSLVLRHHELDTGQFDAALAAPGELNLGTNAFDVYRRGVALESQGARDEAARMYRRALEADPDFSLALRRLGDLQRQDDPLAAARLYSDSMEFVPKEYYGATGALHALAVHKNFVIGRWNEQFIAVPVAVGAIDFSSRWLTSPLRRFAGLFLMRLRLRATGVAPADAAVAPPPASMAATSVAVAAPPRPGGGMRQLLGAPLRWLLRNAYLFQFVLTDSSIEALKIQIDRIDSAWLSRTAQP